MREMVGNIGAALVLLGLAIGLCLLAAAMWTFVIEIVPYFTSRGDFIPLAIAAAIISLLVGFGLIGASDAGKKKDAAE